MKRFDVPNVEGSMEAFEVKADDDVYRILPSAEDNTYEVFQGADSLGSIWPDCIEQGICWYSSDQIPEDTLVKIGEAIEAAQR
ncbi:hypothetical protein [Pedobacter sp. GR22-6]|uniref:hypothetical protein n=1 Tax=Pedobacter sp. GR22-6 TaxID=3127957 RepID=UPI00307E4A11